MCNIKYLIPFLLPAILSFFTVQGTGQEMPVQPYDPGQHPAYGDILRMDSLFFTAYNTCDMETQAAFYADDFEFFHDMGGLSTLKAEILEATKKNICGKVTRKLVEGSMEVYEIPGYGAVAIGYHWFFNKEEPESPSFPGRFVVIWKQEGSMWKMAKVVSLH